MTSSSTNASTSACSVSGVDVHSLISKKVRKMGFRGRKTSNKSPPIFSHEFVIQNHADIVSCVAMLFVVGLLVQATSPLAYMFIVVQHNVTAEGQSVDDAAYFTSGWKDLCTVFFYFLVTIVVHALVQEYLLDKISRKLHLSKAKHNLFNESGQLVVFYLLSVFWGIDAIIRENYILNIAALWEGYPHVEMTTLFKSFYIIQLSYWLHCYPELYFQKVKKEELPPKIRHITANLIFVTLAYVTNFTRVGLCLLVLHYISEAMFHIARLLDFADKNENGGQEPVEGLLLCVSKYFPSTVNPRMTKGLVFLSAGYMASKVVFVLMRLGSIILSVLTFWYGLSLSENQGFDFASGNFNTQLMRMTALLAVGSLQAYLMWNFITSQLARIRELSVLHQPIKKRQDKKQLNKKKERKHVQDDDINEMTEVDQNTAKKHSMRSRPQKGK